MRGDLTIYLGSSTAEGLQEEILKWDQPGVGCKRSEKNFSCLSCCAKGRRKGIPTVFACTCFAGEKGEDDEEESDPSGD